MRLRFLCGQHREDGARAVHAARAKVEALRDAGVKPAALEAAEFEVTQAGRCSVKNGEVMAALFFVAVFTAPSRGEASYGALYDDAGQVIRGLARDWTALGQAARAQSLSPVLDRLERHLGERAASARVLVPGCGLGRLALEAAARIGCSVVANDESSAMLAALAGLAGSGRVVFYPALSAASPGYRGAEERFREVEAVIPDDLVAAFSNVTLHHGDFNALLGQEAAGFDAVATLFFLDCVTCLPSTIAAISGVLRAGGVWVHCGPLKKHREARTFTFADVAALAEAHGLVVEEEERFADCEYIPREIALGAREVYDVQLLVARKRA